MSNKINKKVQKKEYLIKPDLRVAYKLCLLPVQAQNLVIREYITLSYAKRKDLNIIFNPEVSKMYLSKSNAVPASISILHAFHTKKNIQSIKTYDMNDKFLNSLDLGYYRELNLKYQLVKKVLEEILSDPEDKAVILFYAFLKTRTSLSFHNLNLECYQEKFNEMYKTNKDALRKKRDKAIQILCENIILFQG